MQLRYLLDTDWAIQALANRQPAANTLLSLVLDGVAISVPTVAELFDGTVGASARTDQEAQLREFLDSFTLIAPDVDTAYEFALIRSDLRRRGLLIPDFDILIAATAIQHGLVLLTYNRRHFERVSGLQLYAQP